nr:hypothetical protein [Tanacetum cinerariifolium]
MSADSAVTYTSVYSEARSWSIPSKDPYEEAAQQLLDQAPRSLEYVPNPIELEDHVPVHIPKHPKDLVSAKDEAPIETYIPKVASAPTPPLSPSFLSLSTVGNTHNVYDAGAYQGNSYQPQGNRSLLSYHSDNYLGPPGFNQNQNQNNQNQNFHNKNRNQGNHNPQGNNQRRNQFFQGASLGQNPPPAYQALVHQPQIPQPQVVTINEFTNFMKANNATLKNMQTNKTSLTNSNLELKNMFGQFIKMNTALSSGLGTLPCNTITNPKEDLKERETEATKDTVHPTNNGGTKDVQPSVVPTESPILNSEPVIAPIIELVASPSYLMLTLEGFPFFTVNTKEYHSECSGNYHKDNA